MAKESKKQRKEAAVKEVPISKEEIDDSEMEEEDDSESQTIITSAFKPPKGFQEIGPQSSDKPFAKSAIDGKDKNIEIIVIRVPIDFPLESLNGLEIPLESDTSKSASTSLATIKVAKAVAPSKSKKSKSEGKESSINKVEYGVFNLAGSTGILGAGGIGGEIGEMDEFLPLLPDVKSGGYKIASKSFTRHLSIAPLNSKIPSPSDFVDAANTLKNIPYEARVHPEGMKPQYEPYGATTEGSSLAESLERYSGKAKASKSPAAVAPAAKEASSAKKRKMEDADSPAVPKKVSKKSGKKESK
ncbi:hypothetical protein BDR26DRAFT_935579 [Obelidium mucronatum]|nr:hypothetical protein BDR26DRAFT_935579 [Obelidium mucronatum]